MVSAITFLFRARHRIEISYNDSNVEFWEGMDALDESHESRGKGLWFHMAEYEVRAPDATAARAAGIIPFTD